MERKGIVRTRDMTLVQDKEGNVFKVFLDSIPRDVMIKEDIREIQNYEMIVDPSSSNLKRELNNYIWNDKKASIPIDDWNHLLDAMRYGYRRLTSKRRKGLRVANPDYLA